VVSLQSSGLAALLDVVYAYEAVLCAREQLTESVLPLDHGEPAKVLSAEGE
jgi:hypothetical protein